MKTYTHPQNARGPTYVGSRLVHAGETVLVPDDYRVAAASDAGNAPPPPSGFNAVELLKLSIPKINSQLDQLSDAQIEEVLGLEKVAESPRVTLVAAIEAEMSARRLEAEQAAEEAKRLVEQSGPV